MWESLFKYDNESVEDSVNDTTGIHYNIPEFHLKEKFFYNIFNQGAINQTKLQRPINASSLSSPRIASSSPFVSGSTPSIGDVLEIPSYLSNSTESQHSFNDESWEDILIISAYGVLFLVGVFGNVSVMVTMCKRGGTGQPQPHRYSLVLSLAIADLLISLLCYPFNVTPLIMPYLQIPFPACQIMVTMQGFLHASSTFSMAFLTFDRYLIVKKPKMAPKVARWLPQLLATLWVCALILSIPRGLMVPFKAYSGPECAIEVAKNENTPLEVLSMIYICIIQLLIYVLPCVIVCYCHIEVASSLRKRGLEETRLHQKPRQVIIVARDCSANGNKTHKIIAATSSMESFEDGNPSPETKSKSRKLKNNLKSTRFFTSHSSPTAIRPSKSVKTIIRAHRRLRVSRRKVQSSLLADHRSHSIETRMRLAKFLVVLAIIFTACWLPYACTLAVWSFVEGKKVNLAITISLLIGHSHSAISPIVYWIMNRSVLTSLHRLVSSYLHCPTSSEPLICGTCPRSKCLKPIQNHWGDNSSTNEDALGPFHPNYVNPHALKHQPSRCTSHYFH